MWTPRSGHIQTARGLTIPLPSKSKFPFTPKVHHAEYHAPPKPPPLKKPPPPKAANVPVEMLKTQAAELLQKAEELERDGSRAKKEIPLRIQLGLMLLSKEDLMRKILKEWDTKGRGEFLKGEFRLNLRSIGLYPTSFECDELFDSWDDDKGGTLDMKELRGALTKTQEKARQWKDAPDPAMQRAALLRQRVTITKEAAEATEAADELEAELEELQHGLTSKADLRLGDLLRKRRVKPGAVVTEWSKSKGEHMNELSKAEFRHAVQALGVSTTGPNATTTDDIDTVFDTFDEDGGGYLDAVEAAAMIKKLINLSEAAQQEVIRKERQAHAMRAKATRKAAAATAPLPELDGPTPRKEVPDALPPPEPPKPRRRKSLATIAEAEILQTTIEPAAPFVEEPPKSTALPLGSMVSSAVRIVSDLFSTDRSERARNRKSTLDEMSVVASRLKNQQVSRAWNSWADFATARRTKRQQLQRAIGALMLPALNRSLLTWQEYAEDHATMIRDLKRALHHITMQREISAFRRWSAVVRHERAEADAWYCAGIDCRALALAANRCLAGGQQS